MDHSEHMKSLIAFTATSLGTEHPSPFGSAIYESGTGNLVAQAYDTVIRESDPTNHAEVNAIRIASRKLGRLSLRGHTLYSTCEPCPMCMSAIIWAEIDTVVYGASTMEDANAYWPQPSDLSPAELVSRMLWRPRCTLIPDTERALCRALFERCERKRIEKKLEMPPNR